MGRPEFPRTLADGHDLAAGLTPETRGFINDAFVHAASGKTFETLNPVTGEILAQIG